MRAPALASWQPQEPRGTDSALSLSPQQRPSLSLRSPPSTPQQRDGGRHPDAASAGELVSPLMRSPRMTSPLQYQQQHHRRYRSSLPAPPPLRSLTLSSDRVSLRLARAHAPHHQQRTHHVDQSGRPATRHAPPLSIAALEEHDSASATARQGSRAHNRRHTRGRSNVQLHLSAPVLSNNQAEDKAHLSTPVDQRIPAMVPPSYDVYNLDMPGAGMREAAAGATRGAYASSSLTSQAYQLKTAQPQLLHTLKLVDGVWRVVVPPQQQPPTSGPQLQRGTAAHQRHGNPACHSPRNHSCDWCGGLDNSEAASATEAASPTRCHGAKSPTYRIPTATTFTAAGTPCGLSMSACGGDWRSPCLAAANMWCHQQHYPLQCHARTTPASVAMRSSSVGLSDGVDTALSPASTPARAPRTPRRQQQQPHLPHGRYGAHHHCGVHSPSAPSFASEEAYATCRQCNTPHEADLAAGTPSSAVPRAAASVAGRGYQQALMTPTIVIARATPATARDALTATTVTDARWGFTNSAAASTSVGSTLQHDNARTTLPSIASVSAATATADGGRGGAVAPRKPPRPWTRQLRSPSSVYYSPQQFRVGDLQQSAPATATTTPALRMRQPHNWALYGQRGTHTVSQPSHAGSGSILHSCTAVTPLRCSCRDAAGWAGPNVLTTPRSACCGAPSAGEGWRSPMQWNPRQARDDLEMEAVKHVAQFALAQVAATAAAAAPSTGLSSVSFSPSYATVSWNTVAQEAAVAVSPSHARDGSRAEETRDDSVSQDTVALDGEEAAAEWLELLLHYRDRENESGRIRRALVDASAAAQAPPTEAGGSSNPSAAAAAVTTATTISWWATSGLVETSTEHPKRIPVPFFGVDSAVALDAVASAAVATASLASRLRRLHWNEVISLVLDSDPYYHCKEEAAVVAETNDAASLPSPPHYFAYIATNPPRHVPCYVTVEGATGSPSQQGASAATSTMTCFVYESAEGMQLFMHDEMPRWNALAHAAQPAQRHANSQEARSGASWQAQPPPTAEPERTAAEHGRHQARRHALLAFAAITCVGCMVASSVSLRSHSVFSSRVASRRAGVPNFASAMSVFAAPWDGLAPATGISGTQAACVVLPPPRWLNAKESFSDARVPVTRHVEAELETMYYRSVAATAILLDSWGAVDIGRAVRLANAWLAATDGGAEEGQKTRHPHLEGIAALWAFPSPPMARICQHVTSHTALLRCVRVVCHTAFALGGENESGAAAHNIDSSIGDIAAPSTSEQTSGAASAPMRHTAGTTRAAGLLTCQELYAKRASSSSLPLSGDCVLPRISKELSGDRRDDLLQQASSAEAAARIFIWHIGPRTPAHQAPLQSTFPSYFMNVSTAAAATAGGSQLSSGAVGGVRGMLLPDAATAWRVRSYNALYSDEGRAAAGSLSSGWHHGTAGVQRGEHGSDAQAGKRGGDASSLSFMRSVRAVVQPIASVVAVVVDVSGLGHCVRCSATEVIANLRVFAWRSGTAWAQVFMRRRVALRIHIGSWSGTAAAAAADEGNSKGGAGGGDGTVTSSMPPHVMLSRMAMSTHGSASLLRVVSFPPVVQLVPSTQSQPAAASFVCSLPAVHATSLLLEEDAMARRREAQQAAAAAGMAVFPRGRRQRARTGPPSSPPSPQLWMVSIMKDVVCLAARLLSGTSRGDDAAAAAAAAWSRAASISADDGVSRSAAVAAARGFRARVREELGPHQNFGESVLPIALQQMLGSRTMHTHAQLVENEEVVAGEERETFYMQWEASLSAGKPMCLALVALPSSSAAAAGTLLQSTAAADHLPVSLEETCSFDILWLQMLIMAWVVWQLERRVAQSTLVKHLGTSFQLAMLAMALLLGGSTAMMDGLLNVVKSINYMILSLSEPASGGGRGWAGAEGGGDADDDSSTSALSVFVVLGSGLLVLMCVGSGILLNWLVPPAVLRATTFWCVRALLWTLWGLCVLRNTEATVVAALLWTLWQARSLARATPRFLSPAMRGKSVEFSVNDPLEEVPHDAQQARGYVTPLAVSSWAATSGSSSTGYASLRTSGARLKRYEEEGAEHTRRALEELAAHLRANPGRYATRLRDPNGVQHWAGATSTETDEEAEEVAAA
ncbi:putative integral membrane protein [Leishmania donovani]|uniref:Putative integral membrane protein n=1 Tax=Leishmania donovani TaxID=5661 RepID=A0A504XB93_LEIDO|nr:putative integral membrane protein [Leishmania donovani]